jgi:uncharacterized membrane protein
MLSKSERPILDLPASPLERRLQVAAALGFLLLWLLPLLYWRRMPEQIPVHFRVGGQPDAWGGKMMTFLLPGIGTLMYAMLTFLRRLPHLYNYLWAITPENAARQYLLARTMIGWLCAEIVGTFLWLEWDMIRVGLGQETGISLAFVPMIVGAILVTVFIYIREAWRAK